MFRILFFTTLILVISHVSGYDQSLADCQTVAGLFRTTCGTTTTAQTSWTFTGETVTCSGMTGCPDNVSPTSGTCVWTRRLCVTCSTVNSVVYIRVQSNGLPDHCYGGSPPVLSQEIDWTVKFNSLITTTTTTASSQSNFDTQVCTPNSPDYHLLPTSVGYTQNDAGGGTGLVGVALNGVGILNGLSAEKVDPFYPQSWSGAGSVQTETVDACVAHPSGDGMYHYHMLPPCLVNSANIDTTDMCRDVTSCTSSVKAYALSAYTSQANYLKIIAIAKDGHFIYGPYESANTLFDCTSLDMCHGKYINGNYAYVWSNQWPYNIGCWGPGQNTTYSASCSTNGCSYTTVSAVSGSIQTMSMIVTSIVGLLYAFLLY